LNNDLAYGFKLSTLKKLKDVRSLKDSGSLLDFIIAQARKTEDALDFVEELDNLPDVLKTAKEFIPLMKEIKKLDVAVLKIKNDLAIGRGPENKSDLFPIKMKKFTGRADLQIKNAKTLGSRIRQLCQFSCRSLGVKYDKSNNFNFLEMISDFRQDCERALVKQREQYEREYLKETRLLAIQKLMCPSIIAHFNIDYPETKPEIAELQRHYVIMATEILNTINPVVDVDKGISIENDEQGNIVVDLIKSGDGGRKISVQVWYISSSLTINHFMILRDRMFEEMQKTPFWTRAFQLEKRNPEEKQNSSRTSGDLRRDGVRLILERNSGARRRKMGDTSDTSNFYMVTIVE